MKLRTTACMVIINKPYTFVYPQYFQPIQAIKYILKTVSSLTVPKEWL